MTTKRRLSHTSEYFGAPVEEDEEDIARMTKASPRNSFSGRLSMGGRRSSFGGLEPSPEEQSRIADMYKTVIKMSSENKINEKNSWSFDLIDHMGKLIRDEGSRGINFQKASCTLDASIKIYSHRVDDTHASGHRILESLSRNGPVADEEEVGPGGVVQVRVGSKTASSRLNIAETIERNVENINAAVADNVQTTDSMFHKMSKAFDEGGAKGMLMNNMRVGHDSCNLIFSCGDLMGADSAATPRGSRQSPTTVTDLVDISDLIFKSGIILSELSDLELCPALDEYRSTIGVADSEVAVVNPSSASLFMRDLHRASLQYCPSSGDSARLEASLSGRNQSASAVESVMIAEDDVDEDGNEIVRHGSRNARRASMCPASVAEVAVVSDDDCDAGYCDGGFNDMDDDFQEPVSTEPGKIHWDSVFEGSAAPDAARAARRQSMATGVAGETDMRIVDNEHGEVVMGVGVDGPVALWQEVAPVAIGDEYNFFDINAMNKNNSWAGSRHWKVAMRTRAVAIKAAGEEGAIDEEGVEGKKTAKGKKKPVKAKASQLDFSTPTPSEDLFAGPPEGKRKADPTVQTAAAIAKQNAAAESGSLVLPPDSHVDLKDLCRLTLVPNLIVPGPFTVNQVKAMLNPKTAASGTNTTRRVNINSFEDKIWGEFVDFSSLNRVARLPFGSAVPSSSASFSSSNAAAAHMFDQDGGLDNGFDDDEYGGGEGGFGSYDNGVDDHDDTTAAAAAGEDCDTLDIDMNNLLKATRVVEKVDVGYATTTTKVNVRKLKADIWSEIDSNIIHAPSDVVSARKSVEKADGHKDSETEKARDEDEDEDDEEKHADNGKISFQSLISNVASSQQQQGVSLPFYFICLLHLANEKSLKIEDTNGMDDLWISSGSLADLPKKTRFNPDDC